MAKRHILRSNILSYDEKEGGYRQYEITASKVTEAEFKRLVKRANDRLYKLEKVGLSELSREYREVEHYAVSDPNGKGWIYNTDEENIRIRFKSSLRGLSSSEKAYLVNTVRNFMNAQTSTLGGTKKALKSAFNTFKENYGSKTNMTAEQYRNLWKVYRDVVEKDKLGNKGYNVFMDLVKNTNIYELTPAQMKEALSYISNSSAQSTAGIAADVLAEVQREHSDYNLDLL